MPTSMVSPWVRLTRAFIAFLTFGVVSSCCVSNTPVTAKTTPQVVRVGSQTNKVTLTVHIDDKFSIVEKEQVVAGFKEWERATQGIIRFKIKRSGWNSDKPVQLAMPDEMGDVTCTRDLYVVRGLSTDAAIKDIEDKVETEIAGYANPSCRIKFFIIVADQIRTSDQYKAVTVHELGHIIGMSHTVIPNETSMFPGLSASTSCVTMLDLKQFCAIGWSCDPSQLSPCDVKK